ncbi:MAG: altronate dehydratase [Caulobacterales bacterium]|nr:altronate dehydratase [Caulobacterales bacterium]MCA0373532.1 altronate dehydratase family protein [Pseudomonadota bacterium]
MQQKNPTFENARYIKISAQDNVAIALSDLQKGEEISIDGENFRLFEPIKKGHKFATLPIKKSQQIYKFGFPIGYSTNEISIGEWVHVHNIKSNLENGQIDFDYKEPINSPVQNCDIEINAYHRKDGKIGIRNEIWIIPTVGCVAALAQKLARDFKMPNDINIDAIHAFSHQFGCSQLGDDLEATKNIIASLAMHPNSCGVLIIGLGCENNLLSKLLEAIPQEYHYKIKSFEAQKIDNEYQFGMSLLNEIANEQKDVKRQKAKLNELVIGVKCGGSDGFSGLSANPLIGRISKYFTNIGAKVIMTEIPEVFGAEDILFANCKDKKTYQNLFTMIENFKNYFIKNGQKIYENPSPGNKDGGISTLEEKSLGAVQKSGGAIITDVLEYGQRVKENGLSVLNAPGNDAISSTALASSGAHIILFSTGRGTPLGFFVPTLKIASNSEIAKNKSHWIDFDAGEILQSGEFEHAQNNLISQIIAIANGEKTKNEINEIREFALWKNGVTL